MIFNIIVVRRQKLIDLIYATRRNEYFKTPHLALSVLLFVAALAGLTTAYIIILNDGLANPLLMWAAIGVGVLGTFLFFFSLSGFLLKLFQQIKKIYLRGLNMFVLRQINNKINTAYVSIMMVCLMLFVSICTLSSGMGLANAFAADVLKNTPFDATFSVGRIYDDENYGRYPERGFDILTAADQHKVEINSFAKAYQTVRYYAATDNFWSLDDPSGAALESELYFIKLSDYNRVLELQGIAPIKLGSDQYAVDSTTANSAWIDFVKPQIVGRSVAVGGAELRLDATQIFSHALETNVNPNFDLVIVAPDNLLANAPAKRDLLHVQYHQSSQRDERLAIDNFSKIGGTELANSLETKIAVVEHNSSNTTTVAYLAVYLGVVFLIASATVLAITQLSEASDNVRRYQLLDKIGAERRLINRAIFWQAVVYFGAPLVLALAHSLIGISAVAKLVESFRGSDILASSLITAIVIIIVYGGYFWATYLGSKNLIRREYSARRE
jgi:putative ABC transport system permease protein